MGQLNFPLSAKVYLDTSPVIYSVEKHADYWQILVPLRQSLKSGELALNFTPSTIFISSGVSAYKS